MIPRPILGLALLLALSFSSLPARAEPRWLRVSLTENPAHSMFITWNDDTATASRVEYGPDPSYGSTAPATADVVGGELDTVHSALLEGLQPETTYHYRVGSEAGGWSTERRFTTAPADVCAPLTFGVAADNRGNFTGTSMCWAEVYRAIAEEGAEFILNTGDLVHDGVNEDEWADFLETSAPWMDQLPLVPSLGNHDDDEVDGDAALYNRIFSLPRNSANGMEDFFSFDYGNIHFVNLSTQSFKSDGYQMQLQWLAEDLAASDKLWKVVFFHVPVYSSGDHGTDEDGKNAALIPILDAHQVDLVIAGHDHIYERYRPMRAGAEVASYSEGRCYMVSGGGGAATDPLYPLRRKEPGLEVGDNKHHYVRIRVINNVMQLRAVRVSGTGCLQGGEGVIDEFTIVKDLAVDPCAGAVDADGDGFSPPLDCDDNDASIYPGAEEICGDGIDQDCDGQDPACPCADADHDGYGDSACGGTDCDDGDPAVYPGAEEACNGIDDDCDLAIDEDLGETTCGIGLCAQTLPNCVAGVPVTCQALPRPEEKERSCSDGLDNDCDGYIDSADSDCQAEPGCACSGAENSAPGTLWILGLSGWLLLRRMRRTHFFRT